MQELELATGVTTSSTFSEIYLQLMENTKIYDILVKHGIIGYFQHVDDILIVYKDKITDIHKVLDLFNEVSRTLSFTIQEENNSINFLDISIYKKNDIYFKIYRKPTATDLIIPYDSNHPPEHKISAIRYLANRLITYPSKQRRQKERI